MDLIIKMYEKQNSLYSEIFEVLNNKAINNYSDYKMIFFNINDKLGEIDELNKNTDVFKNEYVKMKGISNFNGKEIVRVEDEEKYLKLKKVIEELSDKIILVKKLQDNFIVNFKKRTIGSCKSSNSALNIYIQKMKDKENNHKNTYFDMKK